MSSSHGCSRLVLLLAILPALILDAPTVLSLALLIAVVVTEVTPRRTNHAPKEDNK